MSNANESRRTVYPSAQLLHLWANDCARDLRGGNVSTSNGGATLWSYRAKIAHRFPAEVRAQGNARVFLIRSPFYSKTTAKHISGAHRAIGDKRSIAYPSGFHWTGAELLEAPGNLIDGVPALPVSIYSLNLLGVQSGGGAVVFYGVTSVDADGFGTHRANYAALHAAALAPLEALRKARKYGAPNLIAEQLAMADLYRRTFLPEAERLPIPADAPAIVAAWRERLAKIEAREASERRLFEHEVKAWDDGHAAALAAVRAWHEKARAALKPLSLAEKVTAWEVCGDWPIDGEAPETEQARRIISAMIEGAAIDQRLIPAAIHAALPTGLSFPMRHPMKRKGTHRYDLIYIYEKAGLSAYGSAPAWHVSSYTGALFCPAGRNLLRLSADGGEVITSGGARVPASIARMLWKRHGGLMAEAVEAASVPAFPNADGAAIPFGPFTWTGWIEADANAREAGAGNWLLRVGCHRISPADLCRMANRNAWEGNCK
jgi:phosphoglycolate phosphatase-like HAD superfamily hydrolase